MMVQTGKAVAFLLWSSFTLINSVTLFSPSPDDSSACLVDTDSIRPSILPQDINAVSWEAAAVNHLIQWLPLQKTTGARNPKYEFTGAHMCPPISFESPKPASKQKRVVWFTAITAPDSSEHDGRSENYLTGVRVMILSAIRNSPSLVPIVIYLGGRKDDCFVSWLKAHGAYVMVVDRLSFMNLLPSHAQDHSSASMANWGAFAILDIPRFWKHVWDLYGSSEQFSDVDRDYALYTDADMMFTGDVSPSLNFAADPSQFPPRLMLVLSERWYPHIVREGFNTAAYYVNMSAFIEVLPKLLMFAVDKEWKFSEGLRDQGLLNDFFRAYSNSPGPHKYELEDKTLRPSEMHPYMGWRPYGGVNIQSRIVEAGRNRDSSLLQELLMDSDRFEQDSARIWHFHGAKIWEMRCYLVENAMRWEPSNLVNISPAGVAHCQSIRASSHKGFMVHSLSNPHIYISPCALINYAQMLDYFDQMLSDSLSSSSGNLTSSSSERMRGFKSSKRKQGIVNRKEDDREVYLWAIEQLRQQIIELGQTPVVRLSESI